MGCIPNPSVLWIGSGFTLTLIRKKNVSVPRTYDSCLFSASSTPDASVQNKDTAAAGNSETTADEPSSSSWETYPVFTLREREVSVNLAQG